MISISSSIPLPLGPIHWAHQGKSQAAGDFSALYLGCHPRSGGKQGVFQWLLCWLRTCLCNPNHSETLLLKKKSQLLESTRQWPQVESNLEAVVQKLNTFQSSLPNPGLGCVHDPSRSTSTGIITAWMSSATMTYWTPPRARKWPRAIRRASAWKTPPATLGT